MYEFTETLMYLNTCISRYAFDRQMHTLKTFVRTAHPFGSTRPTAPNSMDCRFNMFSIPTWPCVYCYYSRLINLEIACLTVEYQI